MRRQREWKREGQLGVEQVREGGGERERGRERESGGWSEREREGERERERVEWTSLLWG